jgi:pentatricopeptide repeat protein
MQSMAMDMKSLNFCLITARLNFCCAQKQFKKAVYCFNQLQLRNQIWIETTYPTMLNYDLNWVKWLGDRVANMNFIWEGHNKVSFVRGIILTRMISDCPERASISDHPANAGVEMSEADFAAGYGNLV